MIALALAALPLLAVPGRAPAATAPGAAIAIVELQVPRNDGWVTDLADLLSSSEEAALEARLEEWKQRTGHQIAVLTIPALGGEPIEQAAMAVARAWGVGSGERDDGALLLVARDDRALRIEVGSGLEGALTDSVSGRIIRDIVVPRFRQKQFGPGIRAGVEAMIAGAEAGADAVPFEGRRKDRASAWIVVVLALVLFIVGALIFGRIARHVRRHPRRRGSSWWLGSGGLGGPWGGSGLSGGGGFSGGGFSGFGGGGFSGGGASGKW